MLPRRWVTGVGGCFADAARLLAHGVGRSDGTGDEIGFAELVTVGLQRMAGRHCLGPMEPRAIPKSFASFAQYRRYIQGCADLVRFDQLVREVTHRGAPSAIRAPRTRRPAKSTRELLHAPI